MMLNFLMNIDGINTFYFPFLVTLMCKSYSVYIDSVWEENQVLI